SYIEGLMNLNMGLAVRADGSLGVIGCEAHNPIRFEPNLRNRFVDFVLAQLAPDGSVLLRNLNPQLPPAGKSPAARVKVQGFSDPRGLVYVQSRQRAYAVGQGSNMLIELSLDGQRSAPQRQL